MREIKFRAWCEKREKMFAHESMVIKSEILSKDFMGDIDELVLPLNQDFLVTMQYTGLKDRAGREIYEGDLVKWGVNLPLLISFGWGDDAESYGESYGVLIGSSVFCGAHVDCEVIGNRFENKELLK